MKFSNIEKTVALTELLYQVAPLYHLNPAFLGEIAPKIRARYDAFLATHGYSYQFPLQEFQFLTDDRLVQQTQFGDLVIVANFSDETFLNDTIEVPAGGIVWTIDGTSTTYTYDQ